MTLNFGDLLLPPLPPIKSCKDCGSTTRELHTPGPRCATCMRIRKKAVKATAHGNGVLARFKMTEEQYWKLYEFQGKKCYLCQWATGATKRLAVDHDHKCCPTTPTCGKCTRGLLCGPCNQWLGRMRDQVEYGLRFIEYLNNPPFRMMRLELEESTYFSPMLSQKDIDGTVL